MIHTKVKIFCISVLSIFFLSCCDDSRECTFPLTNVDKKLDKYAELAELGIYGSRTYEDERGSVGGLIIFRKSENEFYAYDMACTYDLPEACTLQVQNDLTLKCPCCGSEFSLIHQGMVDKGPARCPLHRYRAIMDANHVLHIY